MSDGWKWWSSTNGELYTESHETREEAVASLDGGSGHIIEARHDPVSLSSYFDADYFLELADEALSESDLGHPDGDIVFECSPELAADLEARVRTAIDAWQEAHGLKFVPVMFTASRNAEYIAEDDDEAERELRG